MPNVADVLKQDHRRIDQRFRQFEQTRDPVVALEACQYLRRHSTVENLIVYPNLSSEVFGELALHTELEHREFVDLIEQVEACDDENEFHRIVKVLRQVSRDHAEFEETDVLPALQNVLGPEAMERLGEAVAEAIGDAEDASGVIDLARLERLTAELAKQVSVQG